MVDGRGELAGSEGVEGAETSVEFGGGDAAFAVEPAEEMGGAMLPAQTPYSNCLDAPAPRNTARGSGPVSYDATNRALTVWLAKILRARSVY